MHYTDSIFWRMFSFRRVACAKNTREVLHAKVSCANNTREVLHAKFSCVNNTREVLHKRVACTHARIFQGTESRQIDCFLFEREC